ncbi:MAG: hypothetical protein CM15mP79_1260 [Methanobacteriota archaeon]|nr:MAG: hypothetical protein CM15mP79_1260 [Euryarchaeota archaeon]
MVTEPVRGSEGAARNPTSAGFGWRPPCPDGEHAGWGVLAVPPNPSADFIRPIALDVETILPTNEDPGQPACSHHLLLMAVAVRSAKMMSSGMLHGLSLTGEAKSRPLPFVGRLVRLPSSVAMFPSLAPSSTMNNEGTPSPSWSPKLALSR